MADPSVKFKEERVTRTHSQGVNVCAISPDGALIATGSEDNMAKVTDSATGKVIYIAPHGNWVSGIAWHPDKDQFITTCWDSYVTVVVRSKGKWAHRSVFKLDEMVNCCTVSARGLVAVGCKRKWVILDSNWDYSLKQMGNDLTGVVCCISFSSDGSLLAVGCEDGTHHVYALDQTSDLYESLTRPNRFTHKYRINSLSFSPSDSHLIVGSIDGTASLWNVPSSPITKFNWPESSSLVLTGHGDSVYGTLFMGDGRHVITASNDDTFRVWRVSDGVRVETFHLNDKTSNPTCATFNPPTGRLIVGFEDGSLQSWLCPPYVPPVIESDAPFIDARVRLSNAQGNIPKIEGELALIDPSIREARAWATHLRDEITRLREQLEERYRELASIETVSVKEAIEKLVDLEQQLDFAKGEIFTCNRIIDHVTECYNGYFPSLQAGVFFDQWLFDTKLGHLCGQFKELDGDRLLHMNIMDLVDCGFDYNNACAVHIRACLAVHMHHVGELPNVFNWDDKQVSTWLESQGESYASLVNLGLTGPGLIALSVARIEAASEKNIRNDSARALKESIGSLVKNESGLAPWMRKWNGSQTITEYGEL